MKGGEKQWTYDMYDLWKFCSILRCLHTRVWGIQVFYLLENKVLNKWFYVFAASLPDCNTLWLILQFYCNFPCSQDINVTTHNMYKVKDLCAAFLNMTNNTPLFLHYQSLWNWHFSKTNAEFLFISKNKALGVSIVLSFPVMPVLHSKYHEQCHYT